MKVRRFFSSCLTTLNKTGVFVCHCWDSSSSSSFTEVGIHHFGALPPPSVAEFWLWQLLRPTKPLLRISSPSGAETCNHKVLPHLVRDWWGSDYGMMPLWSQTACWGLWLGPCSLRAVILRDGVDCLLFPWFVLEHERNATWTCEQGEKYDFLWRGSLELL